MKKKFSNAWVGSSQIRKQRKYRANAPLHIARKMMSSTLSKELRKKYGKRSFPIRKGDEVKILAGKFKKKTGKVALVRMIKKKVAIEGIQNKKKDGTKINVLFDASKLMITQLNLDDKKRVQSLERKVPVKKINTQKKINVEKRKWWKQNMMGIVAYTLL